ncbi:MAG: carboxypeptidase regulatory-like domain-containing protein [Isosphaeraceae bacterium]
MLAGFAVLLLLGPSPGFQAEEIKGRVQMTDFCSPTVSPAVVYLEYEGAGTGSGLSTPASGSPAIISQSGLQFMPRVRAVALGEAVQFANRDGEAHRVRLEGDERRSSWMIPPGQTQEFRPERPGVLRLECGIHLHMRGALIVSPTRWFQVCSPQGDFRLEGVPPGRYVLVAWHEMGDATRRPIVVSAGKPLEVPQIDLFGEMSLGTLVRKEIQTAMPVIAPVRPWNQPLDAISVLLAAARDELSGSGDARKAHRLVEDAYWGEFEASDLESAVRQHLGFARSASLVRQFGRVRRTLQDVAEKRAAPAALTDESRSLLIALGDSVRELNERGVISNAGMASTRPDTSPARQAASSPALALQAMKRELHRVQYHADRNIPEDAAASLLSVFQSAFVPLRAGLTGKDPVYAWRLDRDFHRLRGELAWGLKGDDLVDQLEGLGAGVDEELSRLASPAGGLDLRVPGSAALATLAEGWPAALAIVVLAALVAGSGRPASRRETSAGRAAAVLFLSAITGAGAGIAIEVVPGLTTGALVHALTGWMGLAAAGAVVLAARRLGRGVPVPGPTDEHESAGPRRPRGPDGSLLLASALVVVLATAGVGRVLFAMLRAHGGSPLGVLGVLVGGGLSLAALTLLAVLGLRSGRALAGNAVVALGVLALFVLSAVLAGKGVFHLQCAGTLDATPLGWLLPGDLMPGLCPSLEGFVLQAALLVAGLWSASRLRRTAAGERDSSAEGQNFLLTSAGRSTAGAHLEPESPG